MVFVRFVPRPIQSAISCAELGGKTLPVLRKPMAGGCLNLAGLLALPLPMQTILVVDDDVEITTLLTE